MPLEGNSHFSQKGELGKALVMASRERSVLHGDRKIDEKHYFLIPYKPVVEGHVLYAMRCLPRGAPLVNTLPKKRVFHLPNPYGHDIIRQILLPYIENLGGAAETFGPSPWGQRLIDLGDWIDNVDKKITKVLFFTGMLVALIRPLALTGAALRLFLPYLGLTLVKPGLRKTAAKLDAGRLKQDMAIARDRIMHEFNGIQGDSLQNPILAELAWALDTDEAQHDPMLDYDIDRADFGVLDKQRMIRLTCKAISKVYADILEDQDRWEKAGLGPEDVRWLYLIGAHAEEESI